jgi:hypothetical protein
MSTAVRLETMQADHRHWREAHTRWRRDIERWQAEHAEVLSRLARLRSVVNEHCDALRDHARSLQESDEAFARHDREIADYLAGGQTPEDVISDKHQVQERLFSQQENLHERFRKHHERVMVRLQALEASTATPR